MAKASRVESTIRYMERVVREAVQDPPVIRLEMTPDEAESLQLVCQEIGGPSTGRRGDLDNIREALTGAGVKHEAVYSSVQHLMGHIVFADNRIPLRNPTLS